VKTSKSIVGDGRNPDHLKQAWLPISGRLLVRRAERGSTGAWRLVHDSRIQKRSRRHQNRAVGEPSMGMVGRTISRLNIKRPGGSERGKSIVVRSRASIGNSRFRKGSKAAEVKEGGRNTTAKTTNGGERELRRLRSSKLYWVWKRREKAKEERELKEDNGDLRRGGNTVLRPPAWGN